MIIVIIIFIVIIKPIHSMHKLTEKQESQPWTNQKKGSKAATGSDKNVSSVSHFSLFFIKQQLYVQLYSFPPYVPSSHD